LIPWIRGVEYIPYPGIDKSDFLRAAAKALRRVCRPFAGGSFRNRLRRQCASRGRQRLHIVQLLRHLRFCSLRKTRQEIGDLLSRFRRGAFTPNLIQTATAFGRCMK
jgi:hypothetical protein